MKPIRSLLLGALGCLMGSGAVMASLEPYDLRVDGMADPVGVGSNKPHFSWKLRSEQRNVTQSAYQLVVGSWDSGKVSSDRQRYITYEGDPLRSTETYHWKLRVWDQDGNVSAWSEPQRFHTGIVNPDDWQADWIAHPRWIEVNRPHLGYRSEPADSEDTPKWLQLDLGRSYAVDTVILRALRHTVSERLGFPMRFKVEIAETPAFDNARTLIDYTEEPFGNPWTGKHTIEADGAEGRYLRITAPELRELNGEICLAFNQVEVYSGGENVALGAEVSASDSVEEGPWSKSAVVDGKGIPGTNPVATESVLMRRAFKAESEVKRATVHVSGLGHYVMYINGERVGDTKLAPGWTDTTETILYDSFNVKDLIKPGENAVGLMLAGGMYNVPDPNDRYTKFVGRFRPLKAIAQIHLEYEDGRTEIITTDQEWKTASGPVTYSHVYGGEDYDASREPAGWNKPWFQSGRDWKPVVVVDGPGGTLRGASFSAPPIKTMETLDPVHVQTLDNGNRVYDLGQNASMMIRLIAQGPRGSRIRITPGEITRDDGSVTQRTSSPGGDGSWWEYTLAGTSPSETWTPEFFYHGARYLEVKTLPAQPDGPEPKVLSLEGLVTHSSAEPVGTFNTSSQLFNDTRKLIRWAQRSNMVSVLTDCPHRERLGWLEQYHLNGPSLRYEFDLNRLYRKTFADMEDAQTEHGLVSDIAPEYIVFPGPFRDSPEWGSAIILAAWQQYLFAGDVSVLDRHYDTMKRYFEYLRSKADNHLLDHGLGDWYDLGPESPGLSQLTPKGVTASATFYQNATTLARIADIMNQPEDRDYFEKQAAKIKSAFNKKYFNSATKSYATGSQTANAMPYVVGLVPDGAEAGVLDAIIKNIREKGNMLTSGDVGHRYLLRALATGNRPDVVWDMHHQSERPGYGYQLKQGATSLTEAWDASRNVSNNHFMLGHIMEWFYRHLAGIAPAADGPGFKEIVIKPQPTGDLKWVEASYNSVRGPIKSAWKRGEGTFTLTVSIPPNTRARVYFPAEAGADVRVDGQPIESHKTIEFHGHEAGYAIFTTGSGEYQCSVGAASHRNVTTGSSPSHGDITPLGIQRSSTNLFQAFNRQ